MNKVAGQGSWNRTEGTGQQGQDRRGWKARKGQIDQSNLGRSALIGQTG